MKIGKVKRLLNIAFLSLTLGGCTSGHVDPCDLYIDPRFDETQVEYIMNAIDLWGEATDGVMDTHPVIGYPPSKADHHIEYMNTTDSEFELLRFGCGDECRKTITGAEFPKSIWDEGPGYVVLFVDHIEKYDPKAPGYIWTWTTLHELGHHWGLDHDTGASENEPEPLMAPKTHWDRPCITQRDLDRFCVANDCTGKNPVPKCMYNLPADADPNFDVNAL